MAKAKRMEIGNMGKVAAVDCGAGGVKFIWSLDKDGKPVTGYFPAIAPVISSGGDLGAEFQADEDVVIYQADNGQRYAAGPDAPEMVGAANHEARDRSYAASLGYKAMTLAALYYAGHTEVDLLVVGLPESTIADMTAEVKRRLTGTHVVGLDGTKRPAREITVKKVLVLPQGLGALIHYDNKFPDKKLITHLTTTFDLGFHTLLFLTMRNLRPVRERTGTVTPGGMSRVYLALDNAVARSLKEAGRIRSEKEHDYSDRLHEYGLAMRTGNPVLRTGHGSVALDRQVFIEAQLEAVRAQVAMAMMSIGSFKDQPFIPVTGGGARLVAEVLTKMYGVSEDRIIFDEATAEDANVLGSYEYGVTAARRNAEAA